MIISCPACKKKFEIDANLIPKEGRNLKCGSCLNVWFYKFEKKISDLENKNKIEFILIENNQRSFVKKSYTDNFLE